MLKRLLEMTAAERLELCRRRIREADGSIQAWVVVAPQKPLGKGPLDGMPFGAKDIYETAGLATEYGSAVYRGRQGRRDAALVRELRRRGAILLGKTHTAAFAYRDPAPTRNPRAPEHTPGGSSSGSAAAVAAGMVPFALGTQTQGSVLRPASFCGVTGFKPTFGLLPMAGILPFAMSLDTAGLFTETAEDMRLLWQRMGYPAGATETLRLGIAGPIDAEPEMVQAYGRSVEALRAAGFATQPVDLAALYAELRTASRVTMFYEAARFHERRFREHGERLGQLAELVRQGLRIPEADYARARESVARARRQMRELFSQTPVILTPAATGPPPRGLASTGDPRMNAPWTALGTPALSIPMPVGSGLPLGLQITAEWGREARVLAAGVEIERVWAGKNGREQQNGRE